MCYQSLELFEDIGVEEVSAASLLSQIELECDEAMFADCLGHSAGSTEHLDEERAGYQMEISRIGSGVSACLLGTD